MAITFKVVGLQIVHTLPSKDEAVALDDAVSRPLHADSDYLYGLYGPRALRKFLAAHLADPKRRPAPFESTKLEVKVPHDPAARFDDAVGPTRTLYLGKNALADDRKAFQALFCDIVARRHGPSKRLARIAAVDTKAGFDAAMLAYPDCIAEALGLAGIDVAVVLMRVNYRLTLPVTILAKKAVNELLWKIETKFRPDRSYYITDAAGTREPLVPPELTRPTITISGRLGTIWGQGAHHPGAASATARAANDQGGADVGGGADVMRLMPAQASIELNVHLLSPVVEASTGALVYPLPVQRLPLESFFQLVRTQTGRAACRANAGIEFRSLPESLKGRHGMVVDRAYFIPGPLSRRHVRFVLVGGEEARYDSHSRPVESSEPGIEVFNSSARHCR